MSELLRSADIALYEAKARGRDNVQMFDVAIEVDVDACCDGEDVLIGGIMEHVEQAGVHSGDSGCSLPPNSLSREIQDELRDQTRKLAKALSVIGLMPMLVVAE